MTGSLAPDAVSSLAVAYGLHPVGPAQRVSARVWQLPIRAGHVAIKRHGFERQAQAEREAAILAHLQAAAGDPRCRVQTLCRTRSGDALWHGVDGPVLVTRWEAGSMRTFDTFSRPTWQALGTSLAALHGHLDTLVLPSLPTLRERLHAIDAETLRHDLLADLDQAARAGTADAVRPYVDNALRLIDAHHAGSLGGFPADDPQQPIHHDYNQFNYLFGRTLPPVILDWEAAIGAPRAFELVRCLNHLPLVAPDAAETFVKAYVMQRPLALHTLPWAVDAACLQHACKRWVLQGWLAEPARFATHLAGAIQMTSLMVDARDRLIDFYQRCARGSLA